MHNDSSCCREIRTWAKGFPKWPEFTVTVIEAVYFRELKVRWLPQLNKYAPIL